MTEPALKISVHRGLLPATLAAMLALPVQAQESGGVQLNFGIGLRLESTENAGLDVISSGRSSRASTALSFGLTSETPASKLSVDGSAQLLATNGSSTTAEGLVNPSLGLTYGREAANANLSVTASLRESDLSENRDVVDFDTGSGSRRTTAVSVGLNWGTAAPLGFGITAGLSDVSYQDSPGNTDNQTKRLEFSVRADLSEVLSLTGNLRGSRFQEDGGASRDTTGLSLGLTLARPRGEMGLTLSHDATAEGDRQSLRFRHSLEMPQGQLGYNLGVSRDVNGNLHTVGGIDWQQDLANGQISLSLDRSVASNSEDSETLQHRLSVDFGTELSPATRLGLALSLARQENTLTGLGTTNADMTARVTHDLTADWALEAGYTHRIRDEDSTGKAKSDKVFLELRRNFSIRF